ncbi:MAG TPA: PqqD family protein [Solirubrobacteraceae bacterium]|nr:PqqD family protein [Solirubrobacteraceae bacterium]
MASTSTDDLLSARVRMPQHVLHRSFVAETVVLNLRTGKYHGLNPTAGRMLDALAAAPTVGAAVPELAGEYGIEASRVEDDVLALCRGLIERGLIEVVDADGA